MLVCQAARHRIGYGLCIKERMPFHARIYIYIIVKTVMGDSTQYVSLLHVSEAITFLRTSLKHDVDTGCLRATQSGCPPAIFQGGRCHQLLESIADEDKGLFTVSLMGTTDLCKQARVTLNSANDAGSCYKSDPAKLQLAWRDS